jgi:hypothetical protein
MSSIFRARAVRAASLHEKGGEPRSGRRSISDFGANCPHVLSDERLRRNLEWMKTLVERQGAGAGHA